MTTEDITTDTEMVFDRVRKLIGGDSDEEDKGNSGSRVVMPDDPGVIKKTAKKVDLPREDIKEAVKRLQEAGAMAYPAIDERAVREDGNRSSKPMDGDDGPSFFYVIYEDDEVLVVGGAKSLISTFGGRLNLSRTETEAVMAANRLAANENGLSEHVVMDDVFMVPKEGGSGDPDLGGLGGKEEEGSSEKAENIREVEQNGFAIPASEVFEEEPRLEEKEEFGVTYGCDGRKIKLTLDPNATGGKHHAVIQPEGEILIPREIAVGLEVEHRSVDWERDEGKVIGRMENGRMEEEVVDTVRTKLAKDNIEEEVQAHLPSSHTNTLGIEENEEVALHLEPDGDDFGMILSPDTENAPTERTVRIKNIGTGTEILCFAVPEEVADVLGVNDDEERQLEWGLRGDELVGTVVS